MSHLLIKLFTGLTAGLLTAILFPIDFDPKMLLALSLALIASLLDGFRLLKEGRYSDTTVLGIAALNVTFAMVLILTATGLNLDVTIALAAIFGYQIHRRLLKFFHRL